jgi:hypothetical protein
MGSWADAGRQVGKARHDPLKSVRFRCGCGHSFEAEPAQVLPSPADEFHPWRYEGTCPACHEVAHQANWERALLKAYANATGPKTAEGKAIVAQNLEGHPTPEEAMRTRFNGLKHGLYAQTASHFPARPGKYAACEGCEHLRNLCPVLETEGGPCLKRTEIFMLHQLAFERRDPRILQTLNMELQARVRVILDEMLRKLAFQGVTLETPAWYYDKDGGFHLAEITDSNTGEKRPIMEIKEHPLLGTLLQLLQKNNMTLADMGMTPKVQDEDELVAGFTRATIESSEEVTVIRRRQLQVIEGLPDMIKRSQERVAKDPVLLEYQGGDDGQ